MTPLISQLRATSAALLFIAAVPVTTLGQSRGLPEPIFPTSEPVNNRIVVEDEYAFSVRRYNPPVDFKAVARGTARTDSPEATTIALLSAMTAGDFEWFRSLWDAESARLMDARDKERGQDAAFWIGTWERTLKDRRIAITNRIETGTYVVITYELVSQRANPGSSEEAIALETPLKLQAGRWVATQELSNDPVLLYWKTPAVRTKRVIRGLHQ